MNTFLTEPREPDARIMSPAEIRKRLMETADDIKETKVAIGRVKSWPASDCKKWTISVLTNRVHALMDTATFLAKSLAGIQEVEDGG